MFSSNVTFEELVLRSLKASPLIKPFLTPGGWQDVKCVYWKVSVGLKCVRTSRIDSFLNLLPLGTGHGGEGHYIWGEGHYFLSATLGRAIFKKNSLRGGQQFFEVKSIYH